MIQRLKVSGLLSFGPAGIDLPLEPLNVLIGPNGSGKSNLLDVVSLLRAAPKELTAAVRRGGGIYDWIWRGESASPSSRIEAIVARPNGRPLRYLLGVGQERQQFKVVEETIEELPEGPRHYEHRNGSATLFVHDQILPTLRRSESVDPAQSILSQRKDPDRYPELFWLGEQFVQLRLYRESSFGRRTGPRLPQKADLPNDFLWEDGRNLGLILNRLKRHKHVKADFLKALKALYDGITDFDVIIEGGTVQVVIEEGDLTVPANRLSDGTLRYVCLLAVLLHPKPPPLVCIEEPELGLHPDLLPTVSDLLREASQRSQLVITTHSDLLVDCLTDQPESVVICEKHEGQTELRRLDGSRLAEWLKKYTLGPLWTRGKLGGNRW